jgi:hypothetical protein
MADEIVVVRVEACWQALRGEVEGIDLAAPVYPDPVWTVRDVLLHCAFWNDETVKAIAACRAGGTYETDTGATSFAAGLDAMNGRVVDAARAVPEDEVRRRWMAAQDALTDAVRALDGELLAREMVAPWGELMPMEQAIDEELGHEQGHVADIISAISASEEEGR